MGDPQDRLTVAGHRPALSESDSAKRERPGIAPIISVTCTLDLPCHELNGRHILNAIMRGVARAFWGCVSGCDASEQQLKSLVCDPQDAGPSPASGRR